MNTVVRTNVILCEICGVHTSSATKLNSHRVNSHNLECEHPNCVLVHNNGPCKIALSCICGEEFHRPESLVNHQKNSCVQWSLLQNGLTSLVVTSTLEK